VNNTLVRTSGRELGRRLPVDFAALALAASAQVMAADKVEPSIPARLQRITKELLP